MKAVITQQKYKCDFCKRRSVRAAMEKHEKRCFRNPNRFCDTCENKGFTIEGENWNADYKVYEHKREVACPYCSTRDEKLEKEIAEREAKPTL